MFLPAETLSTATLASAPGDCLFLAIGFKRTTLFWIVGRGDDAMALMLTGEATGEAFPAAGNKHWSGIPIPAVRVRVDPSSAHTGEFETEWQLKAASDALSVPISIKEHGFRQGSWLKIANVATDPESTIYFRRWAIGLHDQNDDWIEFVSFSDGKLDARTFADPTSEEAKKPGA